MPPSCASAIASVSFETDCMTADTIGMFIVSGQASPAFLLYLTTGVRSDTFAGMHVSDVYPGINRYSSNVCEGSSKKYAMEALLGKSVYAISFEPSTIRD